MRLAIATREVDSSLFNRRAYSASVAGAVPREPSRRPWVTQGKHTTTRSDGFVARRASMMTGSARRDELPGREGWLAFPHGADEEGIRLLLWLMVCSVCPYGTALPPT